MVRGGTKYAKLRGAQHDVTQGSRIRKGRVVDSRLSSCGGVHSSRLYVPSVVRMRLLQTGMEDGAEVEPKAIGTIRSALSQTQLCRA